MSLATEIAADSPTSFWKVDELVGTVAADEEAANAGTYVGGPTLGATGLVPGGTAVTFAGTTTHSELTLPGPVLSTVASVEIVFKWSSGTALMRDNTNSSGWIVGLDNSGTFAVRVGGTTISTSKTTAQVRDGNRHRLLISKNGANVTVYLDGVSIGTSAAAANTASSNPWHVGRNGTNSASADYPAATVDYIAIYPTALSGARDTAHQNALDTLGLSGSSIATSTATTGTLARSLAMTGSSSAAGSATGALNAVFLVGSAAGLSGASATIRTITAITGTGASNATGAGTLTRSLGMDGTAGASADAWGFAGLGLPTRITGTFQDRWRSGLHVGAARPGLRVEVRAGRFDRAYDHWDDAGFPLDAIVGDSDPTLPWQASWDPSEPYTEIPGVRSVELAKTFDQKGVATATIVVDNIAYLAELGGQHSIHRGYLAPLRGYVAAGRTQLVDERGDPVAENEWFEKLNRKRQITVHESYGDQEVKTFTGLIDDVDTTSNPAVITITARSFGGVLSDEEFFGWNIDKALRDPVVFIDKDEADKITKGGYNPLASSDGSTSIDYSADMVNDGDSDTYWRSQDHTGAGNTEWVEIHVGQGRYDDFWLGAEYPDLDVYVSIFAKSLADSSAPTRNGVDLTPDAWVDIAALDEFANATVPGTFGGIPFTRYIHHSNADVQVRDLEDSPSSYVLGDGSIIRVSCRNLYDLGVEGFRAAVRSLYSRKRTLVTDAGATKWVRVGDISDVVRVVLRWAGFKEWEIENTGARLGKRLLANRGMKYMDLIDTVKDGVGFEFFTGDPTAADESIGVPVFRKSQVVATGITPVFTVTDGSDPDDGNPHLLTSVQVNEVDEPLAYIIRARGRTAKTGDPLGGDTTKRIMYVYRPPWSGTESAGVIRHVIHTDGLYTTKDDVRFAAWYLALEEALAAITVGVQIPAFPGIDLDDLFVIEDLGSGLSTRLSVRERRSTNQAGQDASWVMTLGGAITDVPDVQDIVTAISSSKRDA